ncbi:MAG: hypothetical protein ABWX84_05815 [Nocardioides sp.]
MNSALARIAVFVVGLAVVFAGGLAIGNAVGPDVEPAAGHGSGEHGSSGDHGRHGGEISLGLDRSRVAPGPDRRVTFRLLDGSGAALATYDQKHERDLHLVVVGTPGLTDYQHLHPTRDGDLWTARMALAPGRYRVYADGRTAGEDFVAASTLTVTGRRTGDPRTPAPSTRDSIGPYDVALDAADDGTVTLRVTRDGEPVTDLQPYLGASGHLVVIRRGSLDYLHAHPEDGPPGPEVAFAVEFDKPGVHRLFLDFKHDGRVRTAAFTVRIGGHGEVGHAH